MRRTLHLTAAIALSMASIVAASNTAAAAVTDARYTVVDFNKTSVTWIADSKATKYDVYVNGTYARSVAGAGNIHMTLGRLLGPADKVEVATADTATAKVVATYWSNSWVYLPNFVVHFAVKSTALNADAKTKIAAFAATAKLHGFTHLRAVGHDAGQGGAPGAYELGQARATSVLNQLSKVLANFKYTPIMSSWGNSYPVASNATAVGQAANRRVELTLM